MNGRLRLTKHVVEVGLRVHEMIATGHWQRSRQEDEETSQGFELNYRDLVQSAGDIIYALDLHGRFVLYNSKGSDVLGYSPREGIGRHLTDILTPESAGVALEHFRAGVEGKERSPFFEVEAVAKDGSTVHLEVRASSLYRDGILVGRQGIARDISELKRLQEGMARKTERLALLDERDRIARALYESMARAIFTTPSDRPTPGALLEEIKGALEPRTGQGQDLSEQDLTIVRLVAEGLTNKEIASRVYLSAAAVKDHIRTIMDRLNVRRRAALAAVAVRRNLV